MDNTLKVGSVVSNVYFRATKNYPWVGELWVRYLLSMERSHASEKELAEAFEKSLRCTFSTLDEYLDLVLTRIVGLRRRMASIGEENQLEFTKIREVFQHASDYLLPPTVEEYRGICGSMLEVWKIYIAMEVELDHINEARSIYKRCYSKRFFGAGSEDICHSWLCFEREFGNLKDFDNALKKNSSQETKLKDANPRNNELDNNLPPRESKTYSDQCTAFFFSNLHLKTNYEHIRNFFSGVGGVVSIRILNDKFTGKLRALTYVDFLDDEHLTAALAKNK
ncbi:hypothetical protein AHAS_Ahas12G0120100 [Arachis hypogaea]